MPNIYNSSVVVLGGGAEKPVDNGIIYEGKYRVRYFDIDGTILKIEYVTNGGRTTPPSNPKYNPDYLIFDEWNYDTENYIVEQPTDIGATYKTIDDATYLFCRFTTRTGLNPTLAISGFTSIDWGDGTINTNVSHTYAKEGDYIIRIEGNIALPTAFKSYILGSTDINTALKKAFISKNVTTIGTWTFYYCRSLEEVILPLNITFLPEYAFKNCYAIRTIVLPREITVIQQHAFEECYGLEKVVLSQNLTNVQTYAFYKNSSCKDTIFPIGVTTIGDYAMNYDYSARTVVIPKNTTIINGNVFNSMYAAYDIIIMASNVPTLGSSSFNSTNYNMILWVNDDIIEQLKVSTNWSGYAGQMRPLSWYPSLTNPNA